MEVNTSKENLIINKLVAHKRETFTIEGDMIVPDVKPDVLNIINVTGNICTYKKEVLENKVRIEGSANTYIMYLADSDTDSTRGINTSIDFSQMINIDGVQNNMMLELSTNIINSESKVLNGRKINIKLTLETDILVYSNESVEILKAVDNIQDLQKLEKKTQINTLIGSGSSRAYAKDTLNIEGEENVCEILSSKANVINREEKVSYNKVLLKADVNVKILYLTDNGNVKMINSNIPVMGFVDMNDVSENNIINTNYEIRNMIIKPNTEEEHSIYVEIELETSCTAYASKQIELIQDIYSPCEEIEFNMKSIEAMTAKKYENCSLEVKENISATELEGNECYNMEVNPVIKSQRVVNGRIMYEGEAEINFIFAQNSVTNSRKFIIPFNLEKEIEGLNTDKNVNTSVYCEKEDFNITQSGTIECSLKLQFKIDICNSSTVNLIDNINLLENRHSEDSSLVIYIVKKGDTLWNIAKKYRTTIDEIANLNKIEDVNRLQIGQRLLIPRYSRSKLEYTT